MPTAECPNGHRSADPEWCDTCGARLGESTSPDPIIPESIMPEPSAPAAGDPVPVRPASSAACPHCGAANLSDALFCEACGYDFTTGQIPAADPPVAEQSTGAPTSGPAPEGSAWIVVVEVDQQWYRLKGSLSEQPCPPSSSSTVPLTGHTALVGRSSASRGVRPELALDNDTGVSRRHAQFVIEPDLVTVVDLSSTNGTYVVATDAEPDEAVQAIVPGVPSVLADGDRVYLGAWTRLTLRRA